jgi:hypothetical protein
LDTLLAGPREEMGTSPQFDDDWSVEDVVNHPWDWQQVSVARLDAAVHDRKPEFPAWLINFAGD